MVNDMNDGPFFLCTLGMVFLIVALMIPTDDSKPNTPQPIIEESDCKIFKIKDHTRTVYFSPNCHLSVR